MGRTRRPIERTPEKNIFVAIFWHPLRKRTQRIPLGPSPEMADKKLAELNNIFLNPDRWNDPPRGNYPDIREAWLGPDNQLEAERKGDGPLEKLRRGNKEVRSGEHKQAYWMLQAEHWQAEYQKLLTRYNAQQKELQHWRGKKLRTGPAVKLADACKTWIGKYQGRDSDHMRIVAYDLWRFVEKFGNKTDPDKDITTDKLDGTESDIDAWLRGLKVEYKVGKEVHTRPISAGRRQQVRRHVLRFLEDSGVSVNRKDVAPVARKDVRADRGAIRWLEREQAETVAAALAQPWKDLFLVQVALGLRPDELITLKREDFSTDLSELTLSPLKHLTLKQGSRKIRVPALVRPIVKTRLEENTIVFRDPETADVWTDPKRYNRAYNTALKTAGESAAVPFKMDCRIGRRTCGSLLLRNGMSTESVAAILGDDPATVREHYARILAPEVDPTAAALDLDAKAAKDAKAAAVAAKKARRASKGGSGKKRA